MDSDVDGRGQPRFRHICEACGRDEVLTAEAGFNAGWDYPPRMGTFGVVGPRVCPSCPMNTSIWWALMMDGLTPDMLSDAQHAVVERIRAEPESILVPEER